jgi:hypothetical protein
MNSTSSVRFAIDLWMAFYVTIAYVTVRPPLEKLLQ